ncbi:DUF2795 domain-containing protein [Oligoflexus tunisiensis]|uniref:DUF2795 domain-containing protein n=1 Tax=Oligoflexus tunisiensis TaxID=708132 RepID=UPI00114CF711|nr:DUF2795 domain-containing protein [Oligoflexus tunisiensis]
MEQMIQGQSTSALARYLEKIQFPAEKKDILSAASQAGAPEDVIRLMELFPDRRYPTLDDLLRAFGADARTDTGSARVQGVNDTSRVGENAYMQRGVEESAGAGYRSPGPTSSGFTQEEYSGGNAR